MFLNIIRKKPQMGIFDGILLATDMDGTLTDSRGRISQKNAEAILYFQKNGGLFTVASGRPPAHFDSFSDYFVPNTYIISFNGAVIFDHKKREAKVKHTFPEDVLGDILKIVITFGSVSNVGIHSEKSYFQSPAGELTEETLSRIEGEIYDIMFMQNREDTEKLSYLIPEAFPEYKFARSWSEGLEMFPKSAGKGNALKEVKKLTGSRLAVSAGNYDNDAEMIIMADIGVAVKNASEGLKKAADVITVSCDDSAIAEIISELEKERPFS